MTNDVLVAAPRLPRGTVTPADIAAVRILEEAELQARLLFSAAQSAEREGFEAEAADLRAAHKAIVDAVTPLTERAGRTRPEHHAELFTTEGRPVVLKALTRATFGLTEAEANVANDQKTALRNPLDADWTGGRDDVAETRRLRRTLEDRDYRQMLAGLPSEKARIHIRQALSDGRWHEVTAVIDDSYRTLRPHLGTEFFDSLPRMLIEARLGPMSQSARRLHWRQVAHSRLLAASQIGTARPATYDSTQPGRGALPERPSGD